MVLKTRVNELRTHWHDTHEWLAIEVCLKDKANAKPKWS